MSDATISKKASRFTKRSMWSGAGRAGPRRLLIIGVSGLALAAILVGITLDGKSNPINSSDARMQAVNANPGGLNSDQEQNALALRANDTAANTALLRGTSYTPPIAPSVPVVNETPALPPSGASAAPLPPQHFAHPAPPPPPPPPAVQQAVAPIFPPPLPGTVQPQIMQAADTGGVPDPQQQTAYAAAINGLLSEWNGRPPLTDVVLPPTPSQANGTASGQASGVNSAAQGASSAAPSVPADPDPAASAQHVIIRQDAVSLRIQFWL